MLELDDEIRSECIDCGAGVIAHADDDDPPTQCEACEEHSLGLCGVDCRFIRHAPRFLYNWRRSLRARCPVHHGAPPIDWYALGAVSAIIGAFERAAR